MSDARNAGKGSRGGHKNAIITDVQECLLETLLHALLHRRAAIMWPQRAPGAEDIFINAGPDGEQTTLANGPGTNLSCEYIGLKVRKYRSQQ